MVEIELTNSIFGLNSYMGQNRIVITIGKVEVTGVYYIKSKTYWQTITTFGIDSDIARVYNLRTEDYRNLLKGRFNGFQYKTFNEVFFKTEEDAENAINYLESRRVMNALI